MLKPRRSEGDIFTSVQRVPNWYVGIGVKERGQYLHCFTVFWIKTSVKRRCLCRRLGSPPKLELSLLIHDRKASPAPPNARLVSACRTGKRVGVRQISFLEKACHDWVFFETFWSILEDITDISNNKNEELWMFFISCCTKKPKQWIECKKKGTFGVNCRENRNFLDRKAPLKPT